MAEAVETAPKVRIVGERIRIIWTDYGEDGMSITTTGEVHALSLYAASALTAELMARIRELQAAQDKAEVHNLRTG